MRKLIISLLIVIFLPISVYAAENPLFGEYDNQIAFNLGTGVNSGLLIPLPRQFVPFAMLEIQYSRPNTFFTLPARASLNFAQTIGYGSLYGWDWADYSVPIVMISEDVVFFHGQKWYLGAGAGVGFQGKENNRIGSKLLFGFKTFLGYKIAKQTNIEIFTQHFSNGNTGYANYSYGFYGVGMTYNF